MLQGDPKWGVPPHPGQLNPTSRWFIATMCTCVMLSFGTGGGGGGGGGGCLGHAGAPIRHHAGPVSTSRTTRKWGR